MNNNRNNNRRRGRGNSRQQGGQQLNRIDSRARGNAQQLLDKYRKMAHDAHLNGDRVQEEYYLQFADHYFRVLADQRARQEESRQRRDERGPDGGERRYDEPRGRDDYGDFDDDRDEEQARHDAGYRRGGPALTDDYDDDGRSGSADPSDSEFEPADNPFVRDNRTARGPRQSRPRRETRDRDDTGEQEVRDAGGFDASVLPPAIGAGSDAELSGEAASKPRRRTRKPRASDGSDETLEAVG